jgi:hypothetical protein
MDRRFACLRLAMKGRPQSVEPPRFESAVATTNGGQLCMTSRLLKRPFTTTGLRIL